MSFERNLKRLRENRQPLGIPSHWWHSSETRQSNFITSLDGPMIPHIFMGVHKCSTYVNITYNMHGISLRWLLLPCVRVWQLLLLLATATKNVMAFFFLYLFSWRKADTSRKETAAAEEEEKENEKRNVSNTAKMKDRLWWYISQERVTCVYVCYAFSAFDICSDTPFFAAGLFVWILFASMEIRTRKMYREGRV